MQADSNSTGAWYIQRRTYRLAISTHVLYASFVLIASLYVLSVCIYRHASGYSPKTMQVTYCLYIQYIKSMYRHTRTRTHTHTHTHTHTQIGSYIGTRAGTHRVLTNTLVTILLCRRTAVHSSAPSLGGLRLLRRLCVTLDTSIL